MSSGQTDGYNLTVETLEFISANWDTAASNVGETWDLPVLRDGVEKSLYPGGETAGYTQQLRNNDVITVGGASRTDTPTGTEFDFDVTKELDLRIEAMPGNGFSVISDSTDWARFKTIAREALLLDRVRPITDPNCRFDWRWLTITNESPLPETVGNRNHYGAEAVVTWYGFESLPDA